METFFGGSGLSAGGIAPYLAVESVGWAEYFRGPQDFVFFVGRVVAVGRAGCWVATFGRVRFRESYASVCLQGAPSLGRGGAGRV